MDMRGFQGQMILALTRGQRIHHAGMPAKRPQQSARGHDRIEPRLQLPHLPGHPQPVLGRRHPGR